MTSARAAGGGPDGPRHVRGSLERLLGSMEIASVDALQVIFGHWADVVGEDLAAHSRPAALDGDRLVVTCDSSAWASEFRWLERHVVERLAEATRSDQITGLVVRVTSRR